MKKFTYSLMIAIAAILFSGTVIGQITQVTGSPQVATTTNTTLSITKPSGLAIGHFMIATITQADNDDATLSSATATGWTLIDGKKFGEAGGSGSQNEFWGTVLYKFATAADVAASSFSFSLDSDADDGVGGILAFRGVDGTNPFDVTPGTLTLANSDDLSPASILTNTSNAAVIMLGMLGDNRNISDWVTLAPGNISLNEAFDEDFDADLDMGVGAAWNIKASAGATGGGDAELSGGGNSPHASILLALKEIPTTVTTANLWSVSGTGDLRKYTIDPITGALLAGPAAIVTPLTSTAAVAKNAITPNDIEGCIYYLNRDDAGTQNGVVTVYSLRPDGSGHGSRGTIDMNGAGNNDDFSYVRLGFDALGRGWILAGSGSNIYIASFQGNGVNAISSVNTFGNAILNVAAPGAATEFQNGDLAITANGTMYAVANVTDGETYVYTLNSLNTPTTLSRKWRVVDQSNNTFAGSVNGLAWTQSGSLHFSTSTGIYFIDQFTANTVSGTVQASFVTGTDGLSLTDLGSDKFPTQTTLPVDLISFAGAYNNQKTNLNWVTENLQDFDRFEVQRSADGSNYVTVGTKVPQSASSSSRETYLHTDDLSAVSGTVFYYRLKMIDLNGSFKYSNVILVRKESNIKGVRISPNPVISSDVVTVRFEASSKGIVEFRVVDMAGRMIMKQQSNVAEGINSVPLNNLNRLQPGTYVLQMNDGTTIQSAKFIIGQ